MSVDSRYEQAVDAVVSGVASGRSVRAVAREQCCNATRLAALWRAHLDVERGAA